MVSYTLRGTIIFEEYLECHKALAHKRRLFVKIFLLVYGFGFMSYGILSNDTSLFIASIIILMLCLLYILIVSSFQFKVRVKRLWDNYPVAHNEFEMAIDDEGIKHIIDKVQIGNGWNDFVGFRETENLFLVYYSPQYPLIIPKRLISTDIEKIRNLLVDKLKNI